ncbi:hypothetical protein HOG98_01135 [bacterium]|jgi:hypothetical protein|nr:hypothetical protein [bacterium]
MIAFKIYSHHQQDFVQATPKDILRYLRLKISQAKLHRLEPGQLFIDNLQNCFKRLFTPQQKQLFIQYLIELATQLGSKPFTEAVVDELTKCRCSFQNKILINRCKDLAVSQNETMFTNSIELKKESSNWSNIDTMIMLDKQSLRATKTIPVVDAVTSNQKIFVDKRSLSDAEKVKLESNRIEEKLKQNPEDSQQIQHKTKNISISDHVFSKIKTTVKSKKNSKSNKKKRSSSTQISLPF